MSHAPPKMTAAPTAKSHLLMNTSTGKPLARAPARAGSKPGSARL
jgi:hypothetical protein